MVLEAATAYRRLRARGLHHGPAFAGLTNLRLSPAGDSVWADVDIPAATGPEAGPLRVETVAVDICAQLAVTSLVRDGTDGSPILPVGARSLRLSGDPADAVRGHARLTRDEPGRTTADVRLLDAEGRVVVALDGLRLRHRGRDEAAEVDRWFYGIDWQPAPPDPTPTPGTPVPSGRWLLVGEAGARTQILADALRATGPAARADIVPADLPADVSADDEGLPTLRDFVADRLEHQAPDAVVFLCAQPGPAAGPGGFPADAPSRDPGAEALHRTGLLLRVAQAVADRRTRPGCTSSPAAPTRSDRARVPDLAQSSLRGLVRVLTHEHPDLRTTLVDAGPADDDLRDTARLLAGRAPGDELTLRGGNRPGRPPRPRPADTAGADRGDRPHRPVRRGRVPTARRSDR